MSENPNDDYDNLPPEFQTVGFRIPKIQFDSKFNSVRERFYCNGIN